MVIAYRSCRWVVENMEFIETLVPKTYPRIVSERANAGGALLYVALSMSLVACLAVLIATVGILIHRKRRSVRYAQVNFLYLLLVGLSLVAVAAVLLSKFVTSFSFAAASSIAHLTKMIVL